MSLRSIWKNYGELTTFIGDFSKKIQVQEKMIFEALEIIFKELLFWILARDDPKVVAQREFLKSSH